MFHIFGDIQLRIVITMYVSAIRVCYTKRWYNKLHATHWVDSFASVINFIKILFDFKGNLTVAYETTLDMLWVDSSASAKFQVFFLNQLFFY